MTSFRWLPTWAAALFCLAVTYPASAEDETPAPNAPHIALILPTQAHGSLASAAAAVQAGALAAEATQGSDTTPKLRLYATGEQDDEVLTAYSQAHDAGAIGVIGPLTRGAINKLAATGKLDIPVLALNTLGDQKSIPNLFALGLSVEAEARQVARLMKEDKRRKPLIVESDGQLARRMRDAFVDEWKQQSGEQPELLTAGSDKDSLAKLKTYAGQLKTDAIFLAADGKKARLIRSVLGADHPMYATSQAWSGKFGKSIGDNLGLDGVIIVDMPWLLDPWSPNVAQYARSEKPLSADLERLYALGVDAYRLSLQLLVSSPDASVELDGVSGALRLSPSRQFSRDLITGVVGGQPRTPQPTKPVEAPTDTPQAASTLDAPSPTPTSEPAKPAVAQ
jgi:outer membrane PBP1 activator LpoA protein